MPILCLKKARNGRQYCETACPLTLSSVYEYVRVEKPADIPAADPHAVEVVVLDMNHGWPNLGHDSLVHAVSDAVCDIIPDLVHAKMKVRVLSYEVRKSGSVPELPGPRFRLYLGTGGPGHIDPTRNDGSSFGTQGINEDASWEPRLFGVFDAILADPRAALVSVCHTFGVMCRWSQVADPVLRPAEKGGKSSGVLENTLTDQAETSPWFARFAQELPDHRKLRIVDNRLYDLIPPRPLPDTVLPVGYELQNGQPGDALTMLEFARDAGGVMPRVFGSNHHPEIVDRALLDLLHHVWSSAPASLPASE